MPGPEDFVIPIITGIFDFFSGGGKKDSKAEMKLLNKPSDYRNVNPYTMASYEAMRNMLNYGMGGFHGQAEGLNATKNPYNTGYFQEEFNMPDLPKPLSADPWDYGGGPQSAWNDDGTPNDPPDRGASTVDREALLQLLASSERNKFNGASAGNTYLPPTTFPTADQLKRWNEEAKKKKEKKEKK